MNSNNSNNSKKPLTEDRIDKIIEHFQCEVTAYVICDKDIKKCDKIDKADDYHGCFNLALKQLVDSLDKCHKTSKNFNQSLP